MHVSATYKDGGSEGSESEHKVTDMKDVKIIDFKDLLTKTYTYSDLLAVRDRDKDGGSRGSETRHTNMNAAEKAAADTAATSEGKRNIRTSKMELLSFDTKNPGTPVRSTEVPKTTLMHVSANYEDGGSYGSETEHEVTDMKDLKTNNFKVLLPKICTYSDLLTVSDQNKNGGSGKPETEHTNVNSAEMVTAAKTAAEDASSSAGNAAAEKAFAEMAAAAKNHSECRERHFNFR